MSFRRGKMGTVKKIYAAYRKFPIQVKASFWFLICAFLQKGISVITTPIFTRLLSASEYGKYSVFNSWLGIVGIFVSLNLTGGVYQQGLVKFEAEEKLFSSSLQGLFNDANSGLHGGISCVSWLLEQAVLFLYSSDACHANHDLVICGIWFLGRRTKTALPIQGFGGRNNHHIVCKAYRWDLARRPCQRQGDGTAPRTCPSGAYRIYRLVLGTDATWKEILLPEVLELRDAV